MEAFKYGPTLEGKKCTTDREREKRERYLKKFKPQLLHEVFIHRILVLLLLF